jgi:hypothetical protein
MVDALNRGSGRARYAVRDLTGTQLDTLANRFNPLAVGPL